MPASLICQHEDKLGLKKRFIISVLAHGKIREVILPKAGQTAVKT